MKPPRVLQAAGELLLWMLLAAVELWPGIGSFRDEIPLGFEATATVPLLNVWTVNWNVEQASQGFASYWHAPIFYPQAGCFTFSEMQPTSIIAAPVLWCGGTAALAYNFYLCLNLGLTAFFTRRLLRVVGHSVSASLFGSFLMLHLPFIWWQLGVLQLTTLWGPLAVILSVVLFTQRPNGLRSGGIGVAFAACYAACNYYGLFVALLSPALLVLLWPTPFGRVPAERAPAVGGETLHPTGRCNQLLGRSLPASWAIGRKICWAILVAFVLCAPLLWGQYRYLLSVAAPRNPVTVEFLSARLVNYLYTPHQRFDWLANAAAGEARRRPLSAGTALTIMAAIGLIRAVSISGRASSGWAECLMVGGRGPVRSPNSLVAPIAGRWVWFCGVFALLSLLASLGSRISIVGIAPWPWLSEWLPPVALIRSPYRFAVLYQMAVVFLACQAFELIRGFDWHRLIQQGVQRLRNAHARQPTHPPIARNRLVLACSLMVLSALAILESHPDRPPRHDLSGLHQPRAWVHWLANETPRHAAVAFLPFPKGSGPAAYRSTTHWMLRGLQFRRPLANGYSGFFPPRYRQLRSKVQDFPSGASLTALRHAGVRYLVVVAKHWHSLRETAPEELTELELAFEDDAEGIIICELLPQPR